MRIDPLSLVDAELRPFLQAAGAFQAEATPASLRALMAMLPQPARLPGVAVDERVIPGLADAPEVRVFVIGARLRPSPAPAVVYVHGGGFVSGTAAQEVSRLQALSAAHDCVVVAVDYRLAPETPFPGAREDIYAALKWLGDHAGELGVDRSRIAVMGSSAGGGHAAAVAIAVRDRGEVALAAQVLIYPELDDRTGSSRATPDHIGAFGWTAASNRMAWTALLGVAAGSASPPAGAIPACVDDLAGLPPTFIGVGAVDLFVEESVVFAQRLLNAGVRTELYVAPGAFHGFDRLVPDAAISRHFTMAWNAALARALAASPA